MVQLDLLVMHVNDPVEDLTTYEVIALPPSEAGADQETVATCLAIVAFGVRGADGTDADCATNEAPTLELPFTDPMLGVMRAT
jgi:hypothetical protein